MLHANNLFYNLNLWTFKIIFFYKPFWKYEKKFIPCRIIDKYVIRNIWRILFYFYCPVPHMNIHVLMHISEMY